MERNRELAEIRATYDHEKLIGEKNQLILEKKRVQTLWLIVLITCITLCGTTLLLYQRKIIRKIRIIQGARKHLRELTEQIAVNELTVLSNENFIQTIGGQLKQQIELEEHVREQQGDIERIREANTQLLRRNEQLEIEVTKYTSLAQSAGMEQLELDRLLEEIQILQQKENYFLDMLIHRLQMIGSLKEDPRPVTSEEGEQLMEEMESIHHDFVTYLHQTFPKLSNLDLLTCCLIRLKFSIPQIALITAIDITSVSKRKLRIKETMREVKPDIWNGGESLDLYIYKLTSHKKKRL